MPSLGTVLVMATVPVAKILVMCGIGTFLALPRMNVFTVDARKHMNKMVYLVFTPCLIFTRLAQAVTFDKLLDWWYMPINMLLVFLTGALIGILVTRYSNPPQHLRRLSIACCSAGNTGNFPLVLVPGVCTEEGSPFGESAACSQNGTAYVSFGMWMATFIMWTFIFNYVRPTAVDIERRTVEQALKSHQYIGITHDETLHPVTLFSHHGMVHMGAPLERFQDDGHVSIVDASTSQSMVATSTKFEALRVYFEFLKLRFIEVSKILHFEEIFTPPTTSAFIALFIGGCTPLKTFFIGPQAPMRFFTESLGILGDAMIPCMNLILGGNLAAGVKDCDLNTSTIVGIIMTRFMILPAIGCAVIVIARFLHLVPVDPLFHFVLLLQFCMPTAINIGTVAQVHATGEKEAAVVLFWSYTSSAVFLSMWMMLFLSII